MSADYGFASRLLHRVALGCRPVARASLEAETLISGSSVPPVTAPVYIAGLARGGTTILLQVLHATGQFRSLCYADMPFVLMPGLWKKVSRGFQRETPEKERAHGDRIRVGTNSPEAFEEVFWRVHCGSEYIRPDGLVPHVPAADIRETYRRYVSLILASDGRPDARYLAKNNNNVLRLPMLKQVFPDAVLLIPWRDPLQQALSLRDQHERFCARHNQDRFSLEYMNWLGHFEFGRGHRPFRFSEPVDTANDSPDMPDYWLKLWIATYRHLLTTAPVDAVFICYERLCRDPVAQFRRIASAANIVCDAESYGGLFQEAAARPVDRFSDDVVERAAEVRDKLFRRSIENTTDGKPGGNRTG